MASPPPTDELDRLRSENRALNEQVMRLVRTERRLFRSRQELDAHIQRVETLNALALDASRADNATRICELAIEALFALYPFEQAIAFLRNEDGEFSTVGVRGVPGRECRPDTGAAWKAVLGRGDALPQQPVLGSPTEVCTRWPALAAFVHRFYELFEKGDEGSLLALPVWPRLVKHCGLLLLRRVTPVLAFSEQLPDEADPSFLSLLATHVASALENAELYRAAQEAIRLRDEFLSIASHELKTPLTSVRLQLHLLRSQPGAAPAEKSIASVEAQFHRLETLIEQLLDVSRIRVGKLELDRSEVDVGALVGDVVGRLRDDFARSGSSVQLSLFPCLPVRCDRSRIDQVITNVLSNAIKFGQGNPIEVSVGPAAEGAMIQVADHGIGVSREDQSRLFNRFERAVPSRQYGGLGLGLYIARQIVEAHGGDITLESVPGYGTTVTIHLPIGPRASDDAAREALVNPAMTAELDELGLLGSSPPQM